MILRIRVTVQIIIRIQLNTFAFNLISILYHFETTGYGTVDVTIVSVTRVPGFESINRQFLSNIF